jgi:hypothetical protein
MAAQYVPADKQKDFTSAQGAVDKDYEGGKYKDKQGAYEDKLRDLDSEADKYLPKDKNPGQSIPPPVFHKGTDYVPKTGPAILKKGEAVLKKSDADKFRAKKAAYGDLGNELGSGDDKKPKKEVSHIVTRKAKSGGYIHDHHHTHPEHHPMEQHISANQDAMVEHMMQHMGEQNPGEAQADAGMENAAPAAAAPAAPAAPMAQ